jgi:hypothetical protein
LRRYLAEYDFRYNHRVTLRYNDRDRAALAVKNAADKRLTYRGTNEARFGGETLSALAKETKEDDMSESVLTESDNRALSRPFAVLRNGKETSIKTIAAASEVLTADLKDLAHTTDWQLAINALDVAHREYREHDVKLATHLVEQVYRHAPRI